MIEQGLVLAIGGPILGAMAATVAYLFREVRTLHKELVACVHGRGHAEGRLDTLERRVEAVERNGKG